jgi:AraC-like DNA-binding protein
MPATRGKGETSGSSTYLIGMSAPSSPVYDRVTERRRAVVLARHFREVEELSIAQIADRLGRSPATIKTYFYDPSDANKRCTDSPHANNASPGCPAPRAGLGF